MAEASDAATRNQALTLLTAVANLFPDQVLKHVVDILSVIGTSTMTQVCNGLLHYGCISGHCKCMLQKLYSNRLCCVMRTLQNLIGKKGYKLFPGCNDSLE